MSEVLRADEVFAALDDLAYANGRPDTRASLKQEFSDFRVDEDLGFTPSGKGDHLFLQLRKTDLSTTETARLLAQQAGSSLRDVGYSGMKDRRGECSQWFSIKLAQGQEKNLETLADERLELLDAVRNHRKLRIGSHKRNQFEILLRDCQGDRAEFEQRLQALQQSAIPNYFGVQRFGRNLRNLHQVLEVFRADESDAVKAGDDGGRFKRGMLYSAARAYLFNQLLSERIAENSWQAYVEGDVLNLDGTDRCFVVAAEGWDTTLQQRLESFDIHVTGPLPGAVADKDKYVSRDVAADIENAVLAKYPDLLAGLVRRGISAARRPLRFRALNLDYEWLQPDQLRLRFMLPRGVYATSLLRELCSTVEA